jgi:2-hydroxy-6-oxonona-2,4-dienedioate hydrolase
LAQKVSGSPYDSLAFEEGTKEQMRMISNQNMYNPTLKDELKHISLNFKNARELKFPKDLPVILFAQENNPSYPEWVSLHEGQVQDLTHGKVVLLDGGHYLHHTKSKEIAEGFQAFIKETLSCASTKTPPKLSSTL